MANAEQTSDGAGPLASVPGVSSKVPPETQGFTFQQTMLRIRDPKVSLDFYTRVMGMRLLSKFDFQEAKFSLFFLGYAPESAIPSDPAERAAWVFSQPATLELTHNWGTESDESFKGYHDGNSDPRGFGHIGVSVPDVYEACSRFELLGVEFKKMPDSGSMKGLAFIKDPDGYWIEILSSEGMKTLLFR